MGLRTALAQWIAPSAPAQVPSVTAATEIQETRWRGASRALRSMVSWVPGLGSARADLPTTELRTLRVRSRDAMRNHLVARAVITRCRTSIVGTGLMCQSNVDAAALGISEDAAQELNDLLDRRFNLWAEDPLECDWEAALDFYGLQGLTLVSAMVSGDVFALTPMQRRAGGISELKVQLVEADRISNPNDSSDTETLCQGIELRNGVPVGCQIRSTHPGDNTFGAVATHWVTYPFFGSNSGRRRVLQVWNEKDRPGQVRGAPYLAPILEPLKQIERYSSAELSAAVVSAMLTVFIEKEGEEAPDPTNPDTGEKVEAVDTTDDKGNIDLGNGAVWDLNKGEKASVVNPLRPNPNFDPFFIAIVKQIGAALEIPLDELLLNYQASYSAARAAMLQAWRFYMLRRWQLVQQFCAPIRALWLDEEVAAGRITLPNYADPMARRAYQAALWNGPARGSMNELQEAKAARERIDIGISNETMETAAMTGEDWRAVRRQRERELRARRQSETLNPEQYGIAARAGLVTPNLADEAYFRSATGLPVAGEAVQQAWEKDGGSRKPVTLQSDKAKGSQNSNDEGDDAEDQAA